MGREGGQKEGSWLCRQHTLLKMKLPVSPDPELLYVVIISYLAA